jgi:molybdenum cofactor cytidylyltransferase
MQPTAALILGAGLGTRFGGRKLLALIDGKPMLQHVLDLCADTGLAPVVVVLGTDADEIEASCSWRDELRLRNSTPEDGISSSVRIGLRRLASIEQGGRVAVLLGDQPFLSKDQLDKILAASGQIVVPRFAGRPGNPVVLDRSVWPLASKLDGDRGFSQVFGDFPNLVSYVDVPGANPDVDTTDDLAGARWRSSPAARAERDS